MKFTDGYWLMRPGCTPLDGVRHVETSEATKQIKVEYDPNRVSLARIEEVLDEEGYPVEK